MVAWAGTGTPRWLQHLAHVAMACALWQDVDSSALKYIRMRTKENEFIVAPGALRGIATRVVLRHSRPLVRAEVVSCGDRV